MNSTVQLLRDLVALPSVNPAFLPPGDPRAGEARVADFLAATGARAGLDLELHDVMPGRANVLLRYRPTRARRRLLLAPHLDTVGGTTREPGLFTPIVRQGRLYGRGACDTKGSVAVMFAALAALVASTERPRETEIVLAGLVDEEHSQLGARALVRRRFRADLAVVGEPTGQQLVTAHKGNLWLTLRTRGLAAHGSRPELGDNAVAQMARVVTLLETDYATRLRRRRHPLLGWPTVNVGVIRGGAQPNIVPDACEIEVDRRTVPGESWALVRREIRALLRPHGLIATLDLGKPLPCPPLETSPTHSWVRAFHRALRQPRPLGAAYFCDAGVLAAGGVPSVVFGPGDIAQAHTAREWISLRAVEEATAQLLAFFRTLP